MESDPPFDPKVWARLGGELGVLGLSVPEADGGVGGTLVDQAVAIEELGARAGVRPAVRHGLPRDPRIGRRSVRRGARRAARRPRRGTAHRGRRGGGPGGRIRSGRGHGDRRGRRGVGHGRPRWSMGASPMSCWSPRADPTGSLCTPSTPRRPGWSARRWPRSTSPAPRRTSPSPRRLRPLIAGPDETPRVSTMRCRSARRCWRSSRSAPPSICSTCRSSTRRPGCSSVGRSDRSRRSSTGSRICLSMSSTPDRRRITRSGR